VTVRAEDILVAARASLDAAGSFALATNGARIWSEEVPYRRAGPDFFLSVGAHSLSLTNIQLNPRVSFSCVDPRAQLLVQGSGIARIVAGGRIEIRVRPYRYSVSSLHAGTRSSSTIEKRGKAWKVNERNPAMPVTPAGAVGCIRFWLRAARAVSFPLSFFPVCLGTAAAFIEGSFDPIVFLFASLGGVAVHAGINLISDYNDFMKGVDTTDALSTHPGALVDELIPPQKILIAGFLMFALAALCGALLAQKAGVIVLLLGAAGVLGGSLYTGGPVGYKYRGLGEIFVFLLTGPLMVIGAFVVQTRRVDLFSILVSLPLGISVASVTFANNVRDSEDDKGSGIVTLPMRLTARMTKSFSITLTALPFLIVCATVIAFPFGWPFLLVLLSLPSAARVAVAFWRAGTTEEEVRGAAAQLKLPLRFIRLHSTFSLAMVVGGVVAGFLHH
jgi:1,4-dihydroxy-2-naphthoate octaprenyltransferase